MQATKQSPNNSVVAVNTAFPLGPVVEPNLRLPLDAESRSSFCYFRQKACRELSSLLPVEFWNSYVLPMGSQSQPIQYAIIALAGQHKSYVIEKSGEAVGSESIDRQTRSLQNYGRAIKSLNDKLAEVSSHTRVLEETIIACLLFICLNTLQGNDVAALTHLESGLQIFCKHSESLKRLSDEGSVDPRSISYLESTFRRLELQAAYYVGSYQIKSMPAEFGPCPLSSSVVGMTAQLRFQTLQECIHSLEKLVLSAASFMRSVAEPLKYKSSTTILQHRQALYHKDINSQRLRNWFEAFQLFVSLMLSPISDANKAQISKCRISYAVTSISLAVCLLPDETAYDLQLSHFIAIVANAESILGGSTDDPGSQPKARPVFDIEMSFVHPLYFAALKCRDSTTRHRAIELLHKCGKEGVWDGDIMACIARHVVTVEECGRIPDMLTGRLDVPEDRRICGTAIHMIRDEKTVWIQRSTRKWIRKAESMTSVGPNGGNNVASQAAQNTEYVWEFCETRLTW